MIKYILCIVLILSGMRSDNYHSVGRKQIICGHTLINVKCTGSRWKISYLGTDENIRIEEDAESVYISGARKTEYPTVYTDTSIIYPEGYNIIIHHDTVYKSVPEKVIIITLTILITILATLPIYVRIEQYFHKHKKE